MTVKELMEELKNYPDDYDVFLESSYDDGYGACLGRAENIYGDKGRVTLFANCD